MSKEYKAEERPLTVVAIMTRKAMKGHGEIKIEEAKNLCEVHEGEFIIPKKHRWQEVTVQMDFSNEEGEKIQEFQNSTSNRIIKALNGN